MIMVKTMLNLHRLGAYYIHYKVWDEITYPVQPLKFGIG